jgi:DNA polymerase II
MTLWVIPEEGSRKRQRLIDRSFRPSFFAYGPRPRLACLAQALGQRAPVTCAFTERVDIWENRSLPVLEVAAHRPTHFAPLARFVHRFDSTLRLYNSDLMLASLYCWQKRVFPLAKMEIITPAGPGPKTGSGDKGKNAEPALEVLAISPREDEWETQYALPPLRILRARLEGLSAVDPKHGRRGSLEVEMDGEHQVLDDSEEPVSVAFARLLRRYDPDLILTEWGDSTLFPALLGQSRRLRVEVPINRDPTCGAAQRSRARSYMSYGRILFKESATTLFGRLHVDAQNSFIADQCELDGLWELVRVTKLPVQYAARTTTGTGISYMQMELAYRDGVLIPEQKAEPESPKHPDELLRADRGGLVIPPRLGFFTNVGELDFVSEFPSIMAHFNISPETVNCPCCPDAPRVPELGYRICRKREGITSRVVRHLIEKRRKYKVLMNTAPPGDGADYKLRRSALKWLLVCCFGYTGYKNARFGKIEAHESINAMAREKLLVAKETAEQRGFRVLYALVDSLYVQRENATEETYKELGREIENLTNLPIELEARYRYVVFLPSKQNAEIPVPNRFFCVPEEGEAKIRGLECRKHDTPPLVARMQRQALGILAEARDFAGYCRKLEEAREVLRHAIERLETGSVAIEELVIRRRLTRAPNDYRQNNATSIVAKQLDRSGVALRPGEMIEYIVTDADSNYCDDRARALTLWEGWRGYDAAYYCQALEDAFRPFDHYAPKPPQVLPARGVPAALPPFRRPLLPRLPCSPSLFDTLSQAEAELNLPGRS